MPRNDTAKTHARALIARGEAERWGPWRLAATIAEECSCRLLQAHRLARDWTLVTACSHLADLGSRVTVQQLSAWETGRGRPGEVNLDALCRLYATRPDRLGYGRDYTPPADTDQYPVTAPSVSPPSPETCLAVPAINHTAPLAASVLAALSGARRSMAAVLETPLTETILEQWERQAVEYGHAYQINPPARLLADSVTDFLEVRQLLERRQPTDARTRLCRVAAQLAGTAGIALVALGEHREARAWFRVGQLAADESNDRALRAWLFAREAVIPFYFGAPAAALALAERARLLAGSSVCATAAWAPSLEARALARLGRHREAQDAMRLAQAAFAKLGAAHTSDTAYGYTERQLVWHQGSMWTAIGDTRRAQSALQAARELYTPDEHLDRALITMDEATCLMGVGEVTVACRETERLLLGLPREHLTGILINRARDLLAAVPHRASLTAPVRELREAICACGRPELPAG